MLRIAVIRLCLACGLAAAVAGAAHAQQAGEGWRRFGIALRPAAADQTGLDLEMKLRSFARSTMAGPDTGGTGYVARLKFLRPLGPWSAYGHVGLAGEVAGPRAANEPWHGGLGASRAFEGGLEAGASVDYRPAGAELGSLRELTAHAALRSGAWRYQLSLTRGLTAESPALAMGVNLRFSF